jgi:outer membrane protein OmpA-like peptidoglycan-associated protein
VETSPAGTSGARTGKVIIATAVALLVAGGGAWWTARHVEDDLTRRSQAALDASGLPLTVRYDGLDAVLSGPSADAGQAADAIGVVAHVRGTRHVTLRSAEPGGGTTVVAAPSSPDTGSPPQSTTEAPVPSDSSGPAASPAGSPTASAAADVSPTPGTPASAVRLPRGGVHFANGESTLDPRYRPYLDQVAVVLLRNPGVRLVVRGHSDDVGPDDLNWELSRQRAQVVIAYLVSRQVPVDRLRLQAMAGTAPAAPNDTLEGRAANRRVELAIEEV